jgi:hypothetical protein
MTMRGGNISAKSTSVTKVTPLGNSLDFAPAENPKGLDCDSTQGSPRNDR